MCTADADAQPVGFRPLLQLCSFECWLVLVLLLKLLSELAEPGFDSAARDLNYHKLNFIDKLVSFLFFKIETHLSSFTNEYGKGGRGGRDDDSLLADADLRPPFELMPLLAATIARPLAAPIELEPTDTGPPFGKHSFKLLLVAVSFLIDLRGTRWVKSTRSSKSSRSGFSCCCGCCVGFRLILRSDLKILGDDTI